jgi:2-dehydropantoate 2-reductase
VESKYYLIIGNGKLAKHLRHYFSLAEIAYYSWNRKEHSLKELTRLSTKTKKILVAIKDDNICLWIKAHKKIFTNHIFIHFSARCHIPNSYSIHPLYCFGPKLYDLKEYQMIPFILDQSQTKLTQLIPEIPNPSYHIDYKQKDFYHGMCVLAANFPTLLWQKVNLEFETTLKLPSKIIWLLAQSALKQCQSNPKQALSGPLSRNDQTTISAHLRALANDPYARLYQEFVNTYLLTPEARK